MRTLFVLIFIVSIWNSFGQSTYNTYNNKQLYKKLPENCKRQLAVEDIAYCVYKEKKIKIYKTKFYNITKSLGVKVFPNSFNIQDDEILQFIEREILYYLLSNKIERKKREKEKQVYFSANNIISISYLYKLISNFQKYSINKEGKFYKVTLYNTFNNSLTISFPAIYTLIAGKDKVILQKLLYNEFNSINDDNKIVFHKLQDSTLLEVYDDVFVHKGNTFIIGNMSSNVYYDTLDLSGIVFDRLHIDESFSNLFLTNLANDKNIQVNLSMKNYDKIDFLQIELYKLLAFFNVNFIKYFGIEKVTKDKVRGSLLLYNKEMSYMHLLDVEIGIDQLFNEKLTMDIKMYTYMPSHNIKNMFGISK